MFPSMNWASRVGEQKAMGSIAPTELEVAEKEVQPRRSYPTFIIQQ